MDEKWGRESGQRQNKQQKMKGRQIHRERMQTDRQTANQTEREQGNKGRG